MNHILSTNGINSPIKDSGPYRIVISDFSIQGVKTYNISAFQSNSEKNKVEKQLKFDEFVIKIDEPLVNID